MTTDFDYTAIVKQIDALGYDVCVSRCEHGGGVTASAIAREGDGLYEVRIDDMRVDAEYRAARRLAIMVGVDLKDG